MARALARSFVVALIGIVVGGVAEGSYLTWFCVDHQQWLRARGQPHGPILVYRHGVPRAGDTIFACESPHTVGPFVVHTDLLCYCGPISSLPRVAEQAGGTCVVDSAPPQWCAPAYCDEHVDF